MRIFALFDDPDTLQKTRDELEARDGIDVVEVVSPKLDPERATRVAPVMGSGQSISGPAVVNQSGQTAPQATVDRALSSLGRLKLPADERAAFEQALSKGEAQVLVVDAEKDQADEVRQTLKDSGAELVSSH